MADSNHLVTLHDVHLASFANLFNNARDITAYERDESIGIDAGGKDVLTQYSTHEARTHGVMGNQL